jgi:hypothetical protein
MYAFLRYLKERVVDGERHAGPDNAQPTEGEKTEVVSRMACIRSV